VVISSESTLKCLDIHASEVAQHPSIVEDLFFKHDYQGVIVREVIPKDCLEAIVQNLETNPTMQSVVLEHGTSDYKIPRVYGYSLTSSPEDLTMYFQYAEKFRSGCREVFGDYFDFEERMFTILSALAGGLPVSVPTGPNQESFKPVGIRWMGDGREIKIHVGKDFLNGPGPSQLHHMVDDHNQLSYYIPLSLPEAGGELVIYNLCWNPEVIDSFKPLIISEVKADRVVYNREQSDSVPEDLTDQELKQYEHTVFAPGLGDMLLFNGGRYYHRVTPVIGHQVRRTIGGFLGFSQDHDRLYSWH